MCANFLHSPIIGGFLSRPAARWPDTLGRLAFLKNHPYFLPCLAVAIIAFVSFIGGFVALKEVIHALRRTSDFLRIYVDFTYGNITKREEKVCSTG